MIKTDNKKQGVNFVFFGTPYFAVYTLEEMAKMGSLPALIVTAPDRPVGRGLKLTPSPVKVWAEARDIPVLQPEKLDNEFISALHPLSPTPYGNSTPFGSFAPLRSQNSSKGSALPDVAPQPYDLFIVAAYGKIIPQSVLDIPVYGVLNVHPSLLPKYRGASPLQSAILSGDEKTGVTIIRMDNKMDHGDILSAFQFQISSDATTLSLGEKLFREGGQMLVDIIPKFIERKIKTIPQKHSEATYTKKITKEAGLIDPLGDAVINWRKFRAYIDWPGIYFFAKRNEGNIRVKIIDAAFANGAFIIKRVVPEGRKEMDYNNFLRGN